ncbi:hypothetical protein C0993_004098, partial [Termitomyces sp. T159_Od127]
MTPPPALPETATLLAEEVAEIQNSHTQLKNMMSLLLERIGSQATPAPIPSLLTAAIEQNPQLAPPFVPPIAALGVN